MRQRTEPKSYSNGSLPLNLEQGSLSKHQTHHTKRRSRQSLPEERLLKNGVRTWSAFSPNLTSGFFFGACLVFLFLSLGVGFVWFLLGSCVFGVWVWGLLRCLRCVLVLVSWGLVCFVAFLAGALCVQGLGALDFRRLLCVLVVLE